MGLGSVRLLRCARECGARRGRHLIRIRVRVRVRARVRARVRVGARVRARARVRVCMSHVYPSMRVSSTGSHRCAHAAGMLSRPCPAVAWPPSLVLSPSPSAAFMWVACTETHMLETSRQTWLGVGLGLGLGLGARLRVGIRVRVRTGVEVGVRVR